MKAILVYCLVLLGSLASPAGEPTQIQGLSTNGDFTVDCNSSHTYWAVEWADTPQGPWLPSEIWNLPVTGSQDTAKLPLYDIYAEHAFFRVISSPQIIIPPKGASGFTTDTNGWGRVTGNVMFWEGNLMPGNPTGTITPVRRTICFFMKTGDVVYSGSGMSFYSFVLSPFAGSTESSSSGYYSIGLPSGDYSMFVIESPGYYYASGMDGHGNIMPVHVESNQTTVIQFNITYSASF